MGNGFFKEELYRLLTEIPYGKVVTYGELARFLGNKNYSRAVGNTLHLNPDGDKFPCYKVVDRNGNLSRNYAFGGIEEQKRRLENEGIEVIDYRVDLDKFGKKF